MITGTPLINQEAVEVTQPQSSSRRSFVAALALTAIAAVGTLAYVNQRSTMAAPGAGM